MYYFITKNYSYKNINDNFNNPVIYKIQTYLSIFSCSAVILNGSSMFSLLLFLPSYHLNNKKLLNVKNSPKEKKNAVSERLSIIYSVFPLLIQTLHWLV